MAETASIYPVYLIKGEDASLVSRATSSLIASLGGTDNAALGVEEIPEDAPSSLILDACLTPAMFSDRRIVVVRQAGRFRAEEIDGLADYFAAPMDSTSLIFVAGGGVLSQKLVRLVKSHGHILEAGAPAKKLRHAWAAERVEAAGLSMDRGVVDLLVERIGDDVGSLDAVLESLQAAFGNRTIDAEALRTFVSDTAAVAPWDLTDAIDQGDTVKALTVLQAMLRDRHPLQVMATLGKYVTNLARLDGSTSPTEAEVASQLGIAPFTAKKAINRARALSPQAQRKSQRLLAEADIDLRGGSTWPNEYVLEVLVARLSKLGRR